MASRVRIQVRVLQHAVDFMSESPAKAFGFLPHCLQGIVVDSERSRSSLDLYYLCQTRVLDGMKTHGLALSESRERLRGVGTTAEALKGILRKLTSGILVRALPCWVGGIITNGAVVLLLFVPLVPLRRARWANKVYSSSGGIGNQ
jgi:hypothetical protein